MIFVVDDDDAARQSLRFRLECEGLEVADFASAEDFLMARRGEDRAGCLIVDLYMPGMSGLDLLECLRNSGSHLPALVVTGFPTIDAKERAERAKAAFLEKPFNDAKLIDAIRQSSGKD